ncbi:hypothetical protein P280DRAFT_226460 [Massarina eburnea CBS 473.64]|uniref:Uncharacterized protein n=1 Tax=Massarina eburnea CBS 473.64 TaxID=1395130 RepID=A0A6A6SBG7_9PLEO|nr:hypothetical protein P280DRAFT_226460 [Massarina eburnea CBS 473.64]
MLLLSNQPSIRLISRSSPVSPRRPNPLLTCLQHTWKAMTVFPWGRSCFLSSPLSAGVLFSFARGAVQTDSKRKAWRRYRGYHGPYVEYRSAFTSMPLPVRGPICSIARANQNCASPAWSGVPRGLTRLHCVAIATRLPACPQHQVECDVVCKPCRVSANLAASERQVLTATNPGRRSPLGPMTNLG